MELESSIFKQKYSVVYAGFSGGADSTALLVLLDRVSKQYGFTLRAVHFQHGIRGRAAEEDALWCEDFCSRRNIEFCRFDLDVPHSLKSCEGLEEAGRRLRLHYWRKLTCDSRNSAVALGHHGDDMAEDLILRAARGSNVSGLVPMRHVRVVGGVCFIRPLLNFCRDDIVQFLQNEDIKWRSDSSNGDISYMRNFVRHEVLSDIYQHIDYSQKGIRCSLNALLEDADFLESHARSIYTDSLFDNGAQTIAFWRSLHGAIRVRVLRLWLSEKCGYDVVPDRALIDRFNDTLESLSRSRGKLKIPISSEIFIMFSHGKVSFYDNLQEGKVEPLKWDWHEEPTLNWRGGVLSSEIQKSSACDIGNCDSYSAFFPLDAARDGFTVRSWRAGDRMHPFGLSSEVKLKKLFSDRKVISEYRGNYPVLELKGAIVWVPGIRRASCAVLDGSESDILVLRFIPSSES